MSLTFRSRAMSVRRQRACSRRDRASFRHADPLRTTGYLMPRGRRRAGGGGRRRYDVCDHVKNGNGLCNAPRDDAEPADAYVLEHLDDFAEATERWLRELNGVLRDHFDAFVLQPEALLDDVLAPYRRAAEHALTLAPDPEHNAGSSQEPSGVLLRVALLPLAA